MPICAKCGNNVLAGEAFCGECGTPVPQGSNTATALTEEQRLQKTMGKIASGSVGAGRAVTQKSAPNVETKTYTPPPKQQQQPSYTAPPKQQQPSASADLKFCPECGSQVSGAGAFCSECGSSVSGGSKPTTRREVKEEKDTSVQSSGDTLMFDTPQLCAHCGKIVEGAAYNFQNKNYHETCWRCEGCNTSLNGVPFKLKGDRPWCKDCNFGSPKEFCPGCGQLILEGKFTKAMDMTWHYDCFVCTKCSTPISKVGGFIVRDDKPICKNCV